MKLAKAYIQRNFDRASASYDATASIQKKSATQLIDCLKKHFPTCHPDTILDLGTGTGYIPEILFYAFPESKFTLNDLSSNMLDQAKKKLPSKKVSYILGDMEVQDFDFHDLIISNLALQWVDDLYKTIRKFYEKSHFFAFSCLLDGTFSEWFKIFIDASLPPPIHWYPSRPALAHYIGSLQPSKYFCDTCAFDLVFSNAADFMKYLKALGANYSHQHIPISDLKNIIKIYRDTIKVTYKVFFCILSR
ncbi:methyltransferase domain-containing protein [Candidatus Cardinium hertigii]|uniref:methyltransferase domain-containing protein n=1 Tax=Candidatus Cardinium hertigii TaxID=247481 RepID=UPI003D7D8C16